MAGQPVQIHTSRKLVAAGSPACLGKAGSWCYRSPPTWRPFYPCSQQMARRMNVGPQEEEERAGRASGEGWENIKKRCKGEDEAERLCVLRIYVQEAHVYSRHIRPRGIYPDSATLDNNPEMSRRTSPAPGGEAREQIGSGPAALRTSSAADRGVTHERTSRE